MRYERGYDKYCGPAAVAAITGLSKQDAAELLTIVSEDKGEKRPKSGTHGYVTVAALRDAGFEVGPAFHPHRPKEKWFTAGTPVNYGGRWGGWGDYRSENRVERRPTLTQWLRTEDAQDGLFLVVVSGHYVVVRDGEVIEDNNSPKRRGRVVSVRRIMPKEE